MPLINLKESPCCQGKLINKTNGEYTITGPQFTGIKAFMGRTVVLKQLMRRLLFVKTYKSPGILEFLKV